MSVYYEAGRYRVRITGAALGESQPRQDGSTTPQIEISVEVIGCYPTGAGLQPLTGPARSVYLSLTEACLGSASNPGWVAQTLADLGFVGPGFNDLAPLVGKERDAE